MGNQHKKIKGYRDLDQESLDMMNEFKVIESGFAELWKRAMAKPDTDKRHLAIARTKMQEVSMWAVRSVAQPADPFESEGE